MGDIHQRLSKAVHAAYDDNRTPTVILIHPRYAPLFRAFNLPSPIWGYAEYCGVRIVFTQNTTDLEIL